MFSLKGRVACPRATDCDLVGVIKLQSDAITEFAALPRRKRRIKNACGSAWRCKRLGYPEEYWGQGSRAGRTSNIRLMLVTLDTSKLRRWLKPSAYCQVKRRLMVGTYMDMDMDMGDDMRGEILGGGGGASSVQ